MNKLNFAAILAAGAVLALSPAHVAAQAAAKPASLGVAFQVTPDGPTVAEILPDRGGAALGLKVGDVMVEAGGKPISQEVLQEYMKQMKPGDQMSFKVKRAGAILELTGKAVAAPEGAPAPTFQQVAPPAEAAQPEG
jgi:S1-C subfamily serine protease